MIVAGIHSLDTAHVQPKPPEANALATGTSASVLLIFYSRAPARIPTGYEQTCHSSDGHVLEVRVGTVLV